jgi:acetyl esterase/lipase
MHKTLLILWMLAGGISTMAQEAKPITLPIYAVGKAPYQRTNSAPMPEKVEPGLRTSKISVPELTVYLPTSQKGQKAAKRQAILVLPGGGYGYVSLQQEGHDVGKALAAAGRVGIVVKYRLPDTTLVTNAKWVPMADLIAAMRLAKANALDWGIDTTQIGVLGFSAGGHLASTYSTMYAQHPLGQAADRPAFTGLIYAVIASGEIGHSKSFGRLLGERASVAEKEMFSADKHVVKTTPPAFLLASTDDGTVPYQNSVVYMQACKAAGVPAQLHLYPAGGHGYALGSSSVPPIRAEAPDWWPIFMAWLGKQGPRP